MYEKLGESFKKRYPFKISCPSYIYPEDYIENLNLLSPFVDEIELLFFEGNTPSFLPDDEEIEKFHMISKRESISYNIHLPTDLSVTSDNHKKAVSNILGVIKKVESLNPSTYTLHLPFEGSSKPERDWFKRAFDGLEAISEKTGKKNISIETLNYDPFFLSEFAEKGYSICLDAGHLMLYGFDPVKFYTEFKEMITIIHLHGIKREEGKISDHSSLEFLSIDESQWVLEILSSFKGVLSVEVFSFEKLKGSLNWLRNNISEPFPQGQDKL